MSRRKRSIDIVAAAIDPVSTARRGEDAQSMQTPRESTRDDPRMRSRTGDTTAERGQEQASTTIVTCSPPCTICGRALRVNDELQRSSPLKWRPAVDAFLFRFMTG